MTPDVQEFKLTGKQALVWDAVMKKDHPRYIAMFGGFASGKTTVGSICGLELCLRYPGITGAVIRNTHPELRTSTKKVFMGLVDDLDRGVPKTKKIKKHFNEQYNILEMSNGSTVYFLHTASEALYKGPEFGWFLIDQAEELDEEVARKITTRMRQPGMPQKGIFVGNTDKGHNWCYRWFKLGHLHNSYLVEVSFVDNTELRERSPQFFEEMLHYPEEWKKINLYGSWDAPGGLVIEPSMDHMVEPFVPPPTWRRIVALDPAEGTGTCAALASVLDYNDNLYIIGEYYGKGKIIPEHAAGIRNIWGCLNRYAPSGFDRVPPIDWFNSSTVYVDPTSWRKRQALETGFVTVADRFRNAGIPGIAAVNDMDVSLDILRERHEPNPERKHPVTRKSPAPGIYFFKGDHMPNFWEELRSWMIEEPDKEPVHLMDCLRYTVASNISPPKRSYMLQKSRKNRSYMSQ
jgi:hypothetical protein